MITAIIVDDEGSNRKLLNTLLEIHCPKVKVVGEANSIQTAEIEIREKKPDLVFLDIQMPKENGFKLLEKFNPIPFETVFVTSYDQYAITAIKFSALDYLLKPIDIQELSAAVDKALKKIEERDHVQTLYENLLQNIKPENKEKKMAINAHSNTVLVAMSDVGYFEADSNYSFIHLQNGTRYHTAKTLKEIDEFIMEIPSFVRINRSIIINASFCSHYQRGEPYKVTLKNNSSFEISRRRRSEVLDKLLQQMQ
jgi:two-component system, LytTR family, response regulator